MTTRKAARLQYARSAWLPLLRETLDASVGPLAFLRFEERAGVEAVSKAWLAETKAPMFWREFDLRELSQRWDHYGQGNCELLFIRCFVRKAPSLSLLAVLTISECAISATTCELIGACCPSLLELDAFELMTDVGLEAIARGCQRLIKLVLCESEVTDQSIVVLAEHCSRLEFLDLFNCRKVTNRASEALARGCRALKDVDIAGCDIDDGSIIALASGCPLLRNMGECVDNRELSPAMGEWYDAFVYSGLPVGQYVAAHGAPPG